jgi:hypothetical protein
MLICVKLYQNKIAPSASPHFLMNLYAQSAVLSAKYIKERKKIQFPRPFIENGQAQKGAITSIQLFL